MVRRDRYAALFLLGLAVFICQQSWGIGAGSLRQPGPGLLSFGAGAGIGLLALAFLIQTLRGKKPEPVSPEGTAQGATIVAVSCSLFVYTVAVEWLGFVLATLCFVFFLFRTVESESWWRSTVKAILVTAGNYVVFVVWLGLKLPKGILPW